MSPGKIPARRIAVAAEFLWLATTVWWVFGYVWPTLCAQEVPTIQAMLDPALYRHDFMVQEFLRFSPRFYYNWLIYLPAVAGIPLPWVFAGWQMLAVGVLVTGLRALAKSLGLGPAAAAILIVWALQADAGHLGASYFYIPSPAPGLWAAAIAVWGGALAVQQRWRAAYVCFGAATLLQFLVGFYAGLLLLPALWHARGMRAVPGTIFGWAAGLAAVYLPMKFGGITGGTDLGNAAFVETYAQLRHPHHMVPSSWGWAAWLGALAFYVGAVGCCLRLSRSAAPAARWLLGGILALTAGLLLLNYLGVEIWPSAFIAKLQCARTTPLAQLAVLAGLAIVLQERITERDYAGAALLALAPLSPYPGALLCLAAALLMKTSPVWTSRHVFLTIATLLAFYQPGGFSPGLALFYGACVAAFGALVVPAWLRGRPIPMFCAGIVALLCGLACAAWSSTSSYPRWLAGRFAIDAAPFDIPGVLGRRFERYAPLDAIVLVPPDENVWAFKLYARRAIVVDVKHFPFSDRGIAEWRRRISDSVGVPFNRGLDIDAAWAAQPPDRIAAVAARYGAQYVLTRDGWHPQLAGRRIDHFHDWSLWELPKPP